MQNWVEKCFLLLLPIMYVLQHTCVHSTQLAITSAGTTRLQLFQQGPFILCLKLSWCFVSSAWQFPM